jgi:hypothetical protein
MLPRPYFPRRHLRARTYLSPRRFTTFQVGFSSLWAPLEDGDPISLSIAVGGPRRSTHTGRLEAKGNAVATSLNHHFPESTDCQGEFGVIHSLFCPFPLRVWCTRAPGPPNPDEPPSAPPWAGAAPLLAATGHSLLSASNSTARIRSRGYPFAHSISIVDHETDDQHFYASVDPWIRGPASSPVNLFYIFFFSKINPKILENPRPSNFYKNTPRLFWNYVLVPLILHLGLWSTFCNYS